MARFDLYETRSSRTPYLLDVQSGLLDSLTTRVVLPVLPRNTIQGAVIPRLNPTIMIAQQPCIVMTQNMATVPAEKLRKRLTNVEAEHRDQITAAIDFLFQGF
ncbi:CcdB family protein [Maricaulis sp.]|uniref:CcdB family protein n=1 Tax=unclassified Maricaulis TaxID=2632371 RepID=UPI001B03CFF5|nr:CcdB family protein [Maricaulis sp.]MBO6797482.1 CcdB family protein [Maricaulis sp.]